MRSYEGLFRELKQRGLKLTTMAHAIGMSSRTAAKINKGEKVSADVLRRISAFLGTAPEELCREISDNPVLRRLREEKDAGISGGLYHELQVRMAYNSNHIEGSRLTEEQTRMIFETSTIDIGDGVSVDDIMETVHHFRAVDYCIDTAEEPLSEKHIKELHRILKHDTRDALLSWFAVGEYKRRPNAVGGRETAKPAEVAGRMRALLAAYHEKPAHGAEELIAFHAEFEKIHPFQDGNGRVGRLILLKECLRFRVVPMLIEDSKKAFYYRGLSQWEEEPGYLLGTCLDGQDTFADLLRLFEIDPS